MKELAELVFDVPAGGWRPRVNGGYNMDVLLKKQSAIAHMVGKGVPQGMAASFIKEYKDQLLIYGADMAPGQEETFVDPETGLRLVNLYTPPDVVPKEGPFPRVLLPFEYFSNGDPEALRYQLEAFADKYQNPDKLPKRALVYVSAQGVGKGCIWRNFAALMGEKNCAEMGRDEIESNFTGRYARTLFACANEFMSSEDSSRRDATQKMKMLTDGGFIKLERKHENQVAVRNRTMWMFCSNDPVAALTIERTDRRYAVFSNFSPPTPEYTAALNSCFEADRTTFTESFKEELAGFAYYLKNLKVDLAFISRPYNNAARQDLIESSRPSHEMFCQEVDQNGFDALYAQREYDGTKAEKDPNTDEWEFGDAVSFSAIYKAYKAYCKETGQYSLRANKFGGAVKNHLPKWEQVRKVTKSGRQVRCYVVPRKPKPEVKE